MPLLSVVVAAIVWLALASMALVPYWRAVRRFKVMSAAAGIGNISEWRLLGERRADPRLERARQACLHAAAFGMVTLFALTPLMFFLLNP